MFRYFLFAAGAGQLLGLRRDLNAGAMFRHQPEPQDGGQAEGSDGDPRAEAESRQPDQKHLDFIWMFFCFTYTRYIFLTVLANSQTIDAEVCLMHGQNVLQLMGRLCLIMFTLMLFAGCSGGHATDVKTKTYPWFDTPFTLETTTTTTEVICPTHVLELTPANGDSDAYYRTAVVAHLSREDDSAVIEVYQDNVHYINGLLSREGEWLLWEPLEPLQPETSYTTIVNWDCDQEVASWVTSNVGYPVTADLEGMTYALNLADATWKSPAGASSLLSTLLVSTHLLLEVVDVEPAPDFPNPAIDLRVATWYDGEQNECAPTIDLRATWEDPYCELVETELEIVTDTFYLEIWDFGFSGSVAPDGSRWQGLQLWGLVDTRDMADAFGLASGNDAVCQLMNAFGVSCVQCPDLFNYCINIEVVEVDAPRINYDIITVTEDDVSSNSDCD